MTARIAIAHDVAALPQPGGLVLLQRTTGIVFYSNAVGGMIWRALAGGEEIEGLAREIERRFGLTPEQAGADLRAFVRYLVSRQLIVVEEQP